MLLKKPPSKPELVDFSPSSSSTTPTLITESSRDLLHQLALTLLPSHPSLSSLPSSSLPWMVLQEAASYLVASKMRSHLGGPASTFGGLEKILHVAKERTLTQGTMNNSHHDENSWLLLEFFEALKRFLFMAYRGGGGGGGQGEEHKGLSKSTLAFFAANRKVCEDWLSATRPLMLHLSLRSRSWHHVVKYGQARLTDLHSALKKHQRQEVEVKKEPSPSPSEPHKTSQSPSTPAEAAEALEALEASDSTQESGGGKGKKAGKGHKGKEKEKKPPIITPPMTPPVILQRQKTPTSQHPPATQQASSTAAAAAGGGAGGGGGGATSLDLLRLGIDVLTLSQHLSLAYLMLKDGEGILGLQSWVLRSFSPALIVIQRERELAAMAMRARAVALKSKELKSDPLPFGHRPANPVSPSPSSSSSVPVKDASSELYWLSGMATQAQGKYELSLRIHGSFLSQDSSAWEVWSSDTESLDSISPVLGHQVSLRRFIVERSIECLGSVNDWVGLKTLYSHHEALSAPKEKEGMPSPSSSPSPSPSPSKVAHHSSWWKDLSHSVHTHFATASYDSSPSSFDVKPFKGLGSADKSLLLSLHRLSSSQSTAKGQGRSADEDLNGAWVELEERMKESSLVGLGYPCSLPTFLHLHSLHLLALGQQAANGGKSKGSSPLLTPLCSSEDKRSSRMMGDSLSLSRVLLLPPQTMVYGPSGLPSALSSPSDVPTLMKLRRTVWAAGETIEVRHSLLVDIMRAAREGGNYGLCGRTLGLLSSLQKERYTTSRGAVDSVDSLLPLASSATLECSLGVLQIESLGPPALPKALSRMLASLSLLIKKDPDELSASLCKQVNREGSRQVAGEDLAYALMSLSNWMSKSPPQALSQVPEAASIDWLSTLKRIHNSAQSQAPPAVDLLSGHPMESSCHLLALKLCPNLSHLWLQWGNLLYQWTKAAGVHQGSSQGYAAAAEAYSRCLSLSSQAREIQEAGDRSMVILLRLIHIMSILDPSSASSPSLSSIPPTAWEPVIPQLFAHLSSSSSGSGSKRKVLDLLTSLASISPSSLIYPCIVESSSLSSNAADVNKEPRGVSELHSLLTFMQSTHPDMMSQGRMLANEARRVAFTLEERWQALLTDVLSDLNKKSMMLQGEVRRMNEDKELAATTSIDQRAVAIKERYSVLLSPLIQSLDQNLASLSQSPQETPHERWFCSQVLPKIKDAVEALRLPSDEIFKALATAPPPSLATATAAAAKSATTAPSSSVKGTLTKSKNAPKMLSSPSKAAKKDEEGGKKEGGFILADSHFPTLSSTLASPTPTPAQAQDQAKRKAADPSPSLPLPASSSSPTPTLASCFTPLKAVHAQLNRLLSHLSKHDLRRLSPLLSSLSSSSLPLPGHPTITLSSLHTDVHALPTKTRPKRWTMRGSDGIDRVYLLKGRDDLGADERLIQVMRLATGALEADQASSRMSLSIRSYSITPLGESEGPM